ncbi:hypothetical protein LNKW23_28560 [Paralimibaculum aggregatum]|uniref:Sel1 repeat family protein n=1 Tax=Paralimibaculum aggregatum TaxID=3036245 RepID=A0ABQ6LK56_9RHOB|nr:hypothetical protein [Limibaculum sp. NKW23]GMG83643.1 hypothetical protein LNKW23_28560 [Limibaculum sp. NKW23]
MRLLAGLLLIASAAGAQPVETALLPDPSGPARLTLAHWPEGGWVLGQKGRQVEIRFPGTALDIDLAALDRLGPDWAARLAGAETALAAGDTVLRLDLACACGVALTGDREARLAIDIIGPALPPGPALRARGPAPIRAPHPVPRLDPAAEAPIRQRQAPIPDDLAATRDRLVAQLERAAAAGLITLDGQLPGRNGTADRPAAPETPAPDPGAADRRDDPPGAEPAGTAPPPEPAADGEPGAPEMSLADRGRESPSPAPPVAAADRPGPASRAHQATGRRDCPTAAAFALPQPVQGSDFIDALAALNSGLLGEFDRPDPAAAFRLARFYIAHELGAEALTVLANFGPAPGAGPEIRDEALLLAALARAIDGLPQSAGSPLARNCPGPHRLWQALAAAAPGPAPARLSSSGEAERLAALEALPDPLRGHLAVRLGLAAAGAEDWAAARAYRSLARRGDRAGRRPGAARRLLDARLFRQSGETDAALRELRRLWAAGGPEAAEGLLLLAEMITAGELPPAEGGDPANTHRLRLDLGALAFIERGSAAGARALVAEARLQALALGRTAALDLLALGRDDGSLGETGHAAAVAQLAETVPDNAEDMPLALLHARHPERYAAALAEPGFRTALARSYGAIGLPARGEALLSTGDLADPELARALARAHLGADAPADALRLARQLPADASRAEIEAAALAALGRPAEALAALRGADAGSPEALARLAWQAGDWGTASDALAIIAAASPDDGTRARLALATRRAGRAPLPAGDGDPPAPTTADVERYLQALRQETAAIREMLSDG